MNLATKKLIKFINESNRLEAFQEIRKYHQQQAERFFMSRSTRQMHVNMAGWLDEVIDKYLGIDTDE